MDHEVLELAADVSVHRFGGRTNSYLLVRGGRSLLVDCGDANLASRLSAAGLPPPEQVLHTHVQEEHCREARQWPEARILVPRGTEELASDPEGFARRSRTVWEDPAAWNDTGGAEPYGIAGAVTARPPRVPLHLAGSLGDGQVIAWQGLTLRVITLPGHTAEAIGLILAGAAGPLACFTGDLLAAPGTLVNLYDLECAYGRTRLPELPGVLRRLSRVAATDRLLPATGNVLHDGRTAARLLVQRIGAYREALEWEPWQHRPQSVAARGMVGRFACVTDGIYQITGGGNAIVLIEPDGRGMMIDPGPCDYENPNRVAAFLADLAALEKSAGLRRIERMLITHMHGDHYDLAPQVLARYPECRVAAWAPLANLLENPRAYPYACLLPWYNAGWEVLRVDDRLHRREPYAWGDVSIRTVHLPGHCLLHAGHLMRFRGQHLAITGDTIQTCGEAQGLEFNMANHSAPDELHGVPGALATMANLPEPVDLNLGGHGSRFANCQATYRASLDRIHHALPALAALVPGGDLARACIRPSYPKLGAGPVPAAQAPL